MMLWAVVLGACLVAWCAVPPPALARLEVTPSPERGDRKRRGRVSTMAGVTGGCVGLGIVADDLRGAVVGAVLGICVLTLAELWRRHRFRTQQRERRQEVVAAAEAMAGLLQAGRVPTTALEDVADETPLLASAAEALRAGGDIPEALRQAATEPGHEGLQHLADAWQVAARAGSPQAHAWEQAAESLAAEDEVSRLVATEVAAARAGGRVMSVLPLAGIALGYLMGGDPADFLLSTPFGWACLVGAALLASAGVLWIDAIADRAGAP